MRGNIKAALVLALPLLMAGTALGGEGVQVKITNDGTQDIVVTVYDMNASPRVILLRNARINGFTSVPVSAIADASGRANLSWTATSTDTTSTKCGRDDTLGLGNDSSVSVHADASCSELSAGTG
ncbi:MAG TPA: hypothetical protein VK743_16160 [Steroidobacteraceae bacterium]|nr:hypothetical protein [Steroidobacteraceae bacterium]